MQYTFDIRKRIVLIRKRDSDGSLEILHKGDNEWKPLKPQPDYRDEEYCRAMYLGQGCWEDLEQITEEEAVEILKGWGG